MLMLPTRESIKPIDPIRQLVGGLRASKVECSGFSVLKPRVQTEAPTAVQLFGSGFDDENRLGHVLKTYALREKAGTGVNVLSVLNDGEIVLRTRLNAEEIRRMMEELKIKEKTVEPVSQLVEEARSLKAELSGFSILDPGPLSKTPKTIRLLGAGFDALDKERLKLLLRDYNLRTDHTAVVLSSRELVLRTRLNADEIKGIMAELKIEERR